VLIVGAGGAFATVLKTSHLEELVQTYFSGLAIGILVPFIIGAIFRTAIGSGTVGMITAASMLLPLLEILGFTTPIGLVIAMLACASGGFMVFHGNDDFFWVITSTSEMKPEVAYKTLPIISVAQAFTSLAVVFIMKIIFL
jgi:GntP family gluconate:H+ symporter